MKSHFAIVAAGIVFVLGGALPGCALIEEASRATPEENSKKVSLYQDPEGRFQLEYPADWVVSQAATEVQFFDSLEDGVNSIKLSLFEETRTLEEIQTLSAEDQATQTVETFETTEVNGVPALVRQATNVWVASETYYYSLGEEVIALVALYLEDSDALRNEVRQIQNSFQQKEEETIE